MARPDDIIYKRRGGIRIWVMIIMMRRRKMVITKRMMMTMMRVLRIKMMMMRMIITLSVLRCGLVSNSKAGVPGSYLARTVFESAIRVKISISVIVNTVFFNL